MFDAATGMYRKINTFFNGVKFEETAVGASGLLLMFASVLSPIVKIVVCIFILKLAAAILEPLTDQRISDFIYSVSKSLSMLIVMILGVAFMYLITVGLIMCTANFV